jgi:hypothetical protein
MDASLTHTTAIPALSPTPTQARTLPHAHHDSAAMTYDGTRYDSALLRVEPLDLGLKSLRGEGGGSNVAYSEP